MGFPRQEYWSGLPFLLQRSLYVCAKLLQSYPTLCDPKDCSLPDLSVHGILQSRIFEWVAMSSSRESSWPRDQTWVSYNSCIGVWVLYHWCHLGSPTAVLQFRRSVVSDSLKPHGLQQARLPCPSPTPGACSNSCPSSWWYPPTISSSVGPFSSRLQSFPASGSLPMSQLFASDGQRIRVSTSGSVLPMNIQDWFPLGLIGLISLEPKGLSRIFSNTTVQKHQFFGAQLSL